MQQFPGLSVQALDAKLQELVIKDPLENKRAAVAEATTSKELGLGIKTEAQIALEKRLEEVQAELAKVEQQEIDIANSNAIGFSDQEGATFDNFSVNNDATANVLNKAGGVVDATANVAGSVLGLPEFYSRLIGKASRATGEVVNKGLDAISPGLADTVNNNPVSRSIMEGVGTVTGGIDTVTEGLAEGGEVIAGSTDSLYNPVEVNQVAKKFSEDFQNADGVIDGVTRMVKTAASEPSAMAEVFLTSLPHMVALSQNGVRGATLFASLVGEGYEEAEKEFIKRNGREPDYQETATLLGTQIAAVGIDKFVSKFTLGKPILDKASDSKVVQGLVKASERMGNTAAAKAINKLPYGKAAARGVVAAPGEALQEASQTALTEVGISQNLDSFDDPTFQEELYVSAGLGLGAGAVGGAGAKAAEDTVKAIAGQSDNINDTKNAGASTVAAKKFRGDQKEAEKVIRDISGADLDKMDSTERTGKLVDFYEAIQEMDRAANEESDPDKLKAKLAVVEGHYAKFDSIVKAHKAKELSEENSDKAAIQPLLEGKESPDNVERVVSRVLGSKDIDFILDEKTTDKLLKDELFVQNATEEQIAQIQTINDLHKSGDNVTQDILHGNKDNPQFKGITQYLRNISVASATGNKAVAEQEAQGLDRLRAHQVNKLAAIESAIANGEPEIVYGSQKITIGDRIGGLVSLVKKDISYLDKAVEKANTIRANNFSSGDPITTVNEAQTVEDLATPRNTETPVFQNPHDVAISDFTARAKAVNATDEQIEALKPNDVRDTVTGFHRAEDRLPTLDRAKEFISTHDTGGGSYADIDLRNLGGLNETLTHTDADAVYRAFADIIIGNMPDTGVVATRHGGDEMSLIAPSMSSKDMRALLDKAKLEIDAYVKENNLQDITHPKYTGRSKEEQELAKGTGIYFGVSTIDPDLDNNAIIKAAETQTEASKPGAIITRERQIAEETQEEPKNVNRRQAETSGARQAETRRVTEGADQKTAADRETGSREQRQATEEKAAAGSTNGEAGQLTGLKKALNNLSRINEAVLSETNQELYRITESTLKDAIQAGGLDRDSVQVLRDNYKLLQEEYKVKRNLNPSENLGQKLLKSGVTIKGKSLKDFFIAKAKGPVGLIHRFDNFISSQNKQEVKDALPAMSSVEQKAYNTLIQYLSQVHGIINGSGKRSPILKAIDTKYLDRVGDPSSYIIQSIDGKRSIDEGLSSIIGLINYEWVANQSDSTLFNTPEAINSILGRPKDAAVDSTVTDLLAEAGVSRNALAETLGNAIFKKTGLEFANNENVDGGMEAGFIQNLGQLAITVMLSQGLVTQNRANLREHFEGENKPNEDTLFIRVAIDPKTTSNYAASESVTRMGKSFTTLSDVIPHLLNIEKFKSGPASKPSSWVNKKIKGTTQNIPAKTQAVMKKLQKVEFEAKAGMLTLLDTLGDTNVKEMLGFDENIESTSHITNLKGKRGKNLQIARSLEHVANWRETADSGDSTPLYFKYNALSNHRLAMVSNTINVQMDKNHRHIFGQKDWNVTIPGGRTKVARAARKQFKYAVAQGFGFKIDIKSDKDITNEFNRLNKNAAIKAAITAIKAFNSEATLTAKQIAEHQTAIVTAVKEGGEGLHTLDALIALSAYDPNNSFDTNLAIETDGKTSGVAIGMLQSLLDPNAAKVLAAAGVFIDNSYSTYQDYINDGNLDNYEQLSELWVDKLKAISKVGDNISIIEAISGLFPGDVTLAGGELEGINRSLAKNPLMITNYGASIKRVVNEFSDKVIQQIYTEMESAVNDADSYKRLMSSVVALNKGNKENFRIPTGNAALDYTLPTHVRETIEKSVADTFGKALDEALNEQFSEFGKFRDISNEALNIMFKAFHAGYQRELQNYRDTHDGKEPNKKARKAAYEANRYLLPVFKGPMSESLDDGILSIKTVKQRQYGKEGFSNQQEYNFKIRGTQSDKYPNGTASVKGTAAIQDYADGGVGGLIIAIQSIDSAVMQGTLDSHSGLNMFDAIYHNLLTAVDGTQKYNKEFIETSVNYSIIESIQDNFLKVLQSLREDTELRNAVIEDLENTYPYSKTGRVIKDVLDDLNDTVADVKAARKAVFENPDGIVSEQAVHKESAYTHKPEVNEESLEEGIESLFGSPDVDNNNLHGSSSEELDLRVFNSIDPEPIDGHSSYKIFRALRLFPDTGSTPVDAKQLERVLARIVNTGLQPLSNINLKLLKDGKETIGATDGSTVYIKSAIHQATKGLTLSPQEVFVHELVHVVTRTAIDTNLQLRKALKRLYKEARDTLTVDDLIPKDAQGRPIITVSEAATRAAAQERYDYIFNNTKINTSITNNPDTLLKHKDETNGYLHEFVAFGLTNDAFRESLSKISARTPSKKKPTSLLERITEFFSDIMHYLAGRILGIKDGDTIDQAIMDLMANATNAHNERRDMADHILKPFSNVNEKSINIIKKRVLEPLVDFRDRNSQGTRKSTRAAVAAVTAGEAVLNPGSERAQILFRNGKQVLRNIGVTEENVLVKLVREGIGKTKDNVKWHGILRASKKLIDQVRTRAYELITKELDTSFNTEFLEGDKAALDATVLKTDMVSLMDRFTILNVQEMLLNPSKLQDAITSIRDELSALPHSNFYINQARGLGRFMATGKAIDGLRMNAYQIASLTDVQGITADNDISAQEELIDVLASLYALEYTDPLHKERVADIIEREYDIDPDTRAIQEVDNGMEFTLGLYKSFKEESLESLFNGNKALPIKGYTHETYNPYTELKVVAVPTDPGEIETQRRLLAAENYVFVRKLEKDRKDPNTRTHALYISKNNVNTTRLKGAASITSRKVKGTTIKDNYLNTGEPGAEAAAIMDIATIKQREARIIEEQFKDPDYTVGAKHSSLIPVFNEAGSIIDYRYTLSTDDRINLLEMDTRFDHNLGRMFASIEDKVATPQVNKRIVQMAHEDYQDKFLSDPAGFVEIHAQSTDPRLKEIWDLLPNETKRDVKQIFGEDKLYLKAELVDIVFGYSKASIVEAMQSMNAPVIVRAMASNSQFVHIAKLSEKIWQDTVKVAKDNIVIKILVTLRDNIISNNIFLLSKGVPVSKIATDQAKALVALNDYIGNVKRKDELERRLKAFEGKLSAGEITELKKELAELSDDITTNPVKDLLDEGLFQTISEDLETSEDIYSSKEFLTGKVKPYIDKVPDSLLNVGKFVYMAHDTAVYKFLLRATQHSDFVARYALYQHNRGTLGMTKSEALNEVESAFIHYDVPTSKFIQWMNDSGLLLFTKYLVRIQTIIFGLWKEKPATSMALLLLQNGLGEVADINDSNLITSSILGRFNSPADIIESATYIGGVDHAQELFELFKD